MSTLAIKGHPTRGSEVIALLEMLGGHQCGYSKDVQAYWFIDKCNNIVAYDTAPIDLYDEFAILTLEQFLKKFPYKVGDKVIHNNEICIITKMIWEESTNTVAYKLNDKLYCNVIRDLQPYKEQPTREEVMRDYIAKPPYMDYDIKTEETMERITGVEVHDDICRVIKTNMDKHEIVADKNYEIIEENGKYYAVKKKPKYPQTYEECCKVLGITTQIALTYADSNKTEVDYLYKQKSLLNNFLKIIICRDAYWKIAGDWKPNWENATDKFIIQNFEAKTGFWSVLSTSRILTFPTPEMREAFYENFKDLIEQCKELL